ncbi:uncharacterized protein LOC117177287 [Belonocnema kinseyi]|uniref:uncharacterized protein LOC117177287 n=1 Tax=Belonocnema kinseyi TaxID=2817044 RepID=UPI00143DF76D|nr:uncharacterized protein LOC117177287 [Belonocnema kinseyi]
MSEDETQNYGEAEDEELAALRKLKNKLLTEVSQLRDKLKEQERKHELEEYASVCSSQNESVTKPLAKNNIRLIEVSQRILGVSFEDVNKNWLRDNIYEYKATIVTKALRLSFELTVDSKDEETFEIIDVACHFLESDVDTCYFNEIAPWVEMFTKMKNFSYLITAISNYSDQSILRAKILSKLQKKQYVTLENCTEETGGVTIFVHSSRNTDRVHLKFQWATRFLERTWRIEHYFTIVPAIEGSRFIEVNRELLNKFCRKSLGKSELEQLWNELCNAIDEEDEEMIP